MSNAAKTARREIDDQEALVAGVRAGETEAIENLVRSQIGMMISVGERILNDRGLAEDCAQESLITAINKIHSFEGRSCLRTWLHRIAVNCALMKVRARSAVSNVSMEELLPVFDDRDCRIEAPWTSMATPEEVFEADSRREVVRDSIRSLPDDFRLVLILRDIENLSTREVSDALDITVTNVKVRLHRARAALKKLIEPVLRGAS